MISRPVLIAILLLLLAVFGMGFYALHLRDMAERTQHPAADARPVSPPVAGDVQPVVLFLADDRDDALHKLSVNIPLPGEPAQRGREILRALLAQYEGKSSTHPLADGADIKEVFLVDRATAIIDVSAPFADGHRPGIMLEELTLASMAQTLAANLPEITRIKLLVEGKERETLAGHVDLTEFYPVSSAARWAENQSPVASRQ